MKKHRHPLHPVAEKLIFSAGLDYFSTSKKSLWGPGEPETLSILSEIEIKKAGCWLDLAAGDGRYATELSNKLDKLVVADIDLGAMSKLFYRVDPNHREILSFTQVNIKDSLPFAGNSFDGLICTGTLHLFNYTVLPAILLEMLRIIKKGGKLIMDFAVDVERIYPDGRLFTYRGEHNYTAISAYHVLQSVLGENLVDISESSFEDDMTGVRGHGYKTQGKFLLIQATKR